MKLKTIQTIDKQIYNEDQAITGTDDRPKNSARSNSPTQDDMLKGDGINEKMFQTNMTLAKSKA